MQAPKTLYKCCGPDRMDMFKNRLIRFTQRPALNDIFEMAPVAVESDPASWKAAVDSFNLPAGAWQPGPDSAEGKQELCDYTLGHVLVLCLTAEWDNLPMWAYYADEHRGFVVGFDASSEFFVDLKEVIYAEERPTFNGPSDFGTAIYTKSIHWQHEREWRARRLLGLHIPDQTKSAAWPIYLFAFKPGMVTEVTIGHRMSMENRSALLRILHGPEYEHVTIWQAKPSKGGFALERERLARGPDLYKRLQDATTEWDQFIRKQ